MSDDEVAGFSSGSDEDDEMSDGGTGWTGTTSDRQHIKPEGGSKPSGAPPPALEGMRALDPFNAAVKRENRRAARQRRASLHSQELPPPSRDWLNNPSISNVMISGSFGIQSVNMIKVAETLRNTTYDPSQMTCVSIQLRNPPSRCNVFTNGKFTLTGAKSVKKAVLAARSVGRALQTQMVEVREKRHVNDPSIVLKRWKEQLYPNVRVKWTIAGMTGSAKFPFGVDLNAASQASDWCNYDADMHGYMIVNHPKYEKGVVHVYPTGAVTILGCKTRSQFVRMLNDSYDLCAQFEKVDTETLIQEQLEAERDARLQEQEQARQAEVQRQQTLIDEGFGTSLAEEVSFEDLFSDMPMDVDDPIDMVDINPLPM